MTSAVRARALGSVIGAATGDALGAPYEFQGPIPDSDDVAMTGGGVLGWDVGEWTDDTSMSIVVLEAAAAASLGHDLRLPSSLDQIAREWYAWSMGTPDIGAMTSKVMGAAIARAVADGRSLPTAADFEAAAHCVAEHTTNNAGNGCLLRTHAVALPYLHADDEVLVEAVLAVCRLTHQGPDVEEACILWTFAVRHAILTGEVDVRVALDLLEPERAELWAQRIEEAETAVPTAFPRNGWVVHAFQAAWSAIHGVLPIPRGKFAQRAAMTEALEAAVRAGYDTDTLASITGGLLGAALGHKAIQPEWRRALFGWPGYEVSELISLVERVIDARASQPEPVGPTAA
ncbi:ADP-ribosylation/Crystallin J1 [Brachybacterium nesterenkovii]|uniref:ADP-ribosylation/Crystallin J1 n=1 Tax=Brachybacterium nesterenkovii TaxID=47847 RepID=A0A1X6X0F9_9MICO|nr:ADP-ribosylation/Crystallin J1 [Brachybacterium nesterenkovii]